MKVVLMLCETFPPEADVGGLRGAAFCKYLPKFGWEPLIFSRNRPSGDPENNPIMEIPGLPGKEKQITFYYGRQDEKEALLNRTFLGRLKHFFMPDYAYPSGIVEKWLKESEIHLKNVKFDCVWGTSPSLGCLTVAKHIATAQHIPWIADFRDITEQDEFNSFRDKLFKFRMIMRRKRIIHSAAVIITVSKHHARVLKKKSKQNVQVIYNGYDPDVFSPASGEKSQKFSIIYSGKIFNKYLHDPSVFFEGIDLLLNSSSDFRNDVEILFYGSDAESVRKMVTNYKCSNLIKCSEPIPYVNMARLLKESSVLLLLNYRGRKGVLTTKFFEYLAVKKPILCVPGDGGELDSLLNRTGSGKSCATAEEAGSFLNKWYLEWKKNGSTQIDSNDEEIRRFSRVEETGQLAALLDKVVQSISI